MSELSDLSVLDEDDGDAKQKQEQKQGEGGRKWKKQGRPRKESECP
jgi:hypothetical protein